MAIHIS